MSDGAPAGGRACRRAWRLPGARRLRHNAANKKPPRRRSGGHMQVLMFHLMPYPALPEAVH
ncbi:MAG: hypothetical protein AB7K86_22485, partial [Rhodospirillales bacterium]